MLYNSEVWYGLTSKQVQKLIAVDVLFLRRLLNVVSGCPIEALFLECGCVPFDIIVRTRRLKYLHHLVTRNQDEMLFRVFNAQLQSPVKNDWTETVKEDLEVFGFQVENIWDLRSISRGKFKDMIKQKGREVALKQLLARKEKHSKLTNLEYYEFKMQDYLSNGTLTIQQAQVVFKSRCRMTTYWENFKGWKLQKICPVCKDVAQIDTQSHSFQCKGIREVIAINGELKDIYQGNLSNQLVMTVVNIETFRKRYLEE